MSDLDALIARLEAATEGSRELDCLVAARVGWKRLTRSETRERHGGSHGLWLPPGERKDCWDEAQRDPRMFTRSIDAALTLVPHGWEGGFSFIHAPFRAGGPPYEGSVVERTVQWSQADIDAPEEPYFGTAIGKGHTPAVALCIAALKARKENPNA